MTVPRQDDLLACLGPPDQFGQLALGFCQRHLHGSLQTVHSAAFLDQIVDHSNGVALEDHFAETFKEARGKVDAELKLGF